MQVNVILDVVDKESCLQSDMLRSKIKAEIPLPTVFGVKIMISNLITQRTLMFAVGGQFTDIWSTEAPCHIEFQPQTFRDLVSRAQTARDSVEMSREILKTHLTVFLQAFRVQITVVETETATQVPLFQCLGSRSKDTHIKQVEIGNEVFFAEIERFLSHSVQARRELPARTLLRDIAHIIIQGVELHIQAILIRRLFKLLATVLLIPCNHFQATRRQIDETLRNRLVMKDLLIRQAVKVSLQVVVFRNQLARHRVALTLHDARIDIVIAKLEVGESP